MSPGTWHLIRAAVRRDRVRILVWVAGLGAMVALSAESVRNVFPTQADIINAAEASRNPAILAFQGPDQGLETLGGQVAFQIGAPGLVFVALMALLMTGRLTRVEEEAGRWELIRALPVGRNAPLAAAGIVVGAMSTLIAVVIAASLIAFDLPAAGSLNFALGYALTGAVFTGVTLVTAQVTDNPKLANGLAGVVLGVSFVLRAIGDMSSGVLSWCSPLGWVQGARPFADERWWALLIPAVVAVVLVRVAIELQARRDLGAGLVQPRAGPAHGGERLAGPLALAVRLQRGAVAGWTAGVAFLALVYGSITQAIEGFVEDNPELADFLAAAGGDLTQSYIATAARTTVLIGSGFAIQSVLRIRSEETNARTEPVIATPTTRLEYWLAHLSVAVGGSIVVVLTSGIVLGASAAIAVGDVALLWDGTWAAIVNLPATLVLIGIAALVVGAAPRFSGASWAALAVGFVIAMFGPILDLPSWAMRISPFENVALVPAESLAIGPVLVLTAIATACLLAGLAGYRRRDIPA